ncbi:MAG TPA: iron-sulfur cluster repair di-iron protein [Terriglobales bacterium]
MNLDTTQTVREMALSIPAATRVFEKFGIDYCCGGNKSLEKACDDANLSLDHVLESLASAATSNPSGSGHKNWASGALADLTAHINHTHHKYTREEIARLGPLFDKVCNVHGPKHPELLEMRHDFRSLAQELTTHMMKEEMVLFPYIERMEEAVTAGEPILPAPFGTVNNPVAMMIHEHDDAGNLLRNLRSRSNGYQPPEGACISYQTLYSALDAFEKDLHQHIHLENNVLFPRAIAMEGRQ